MELITKLKETYESLSDEHKDVFMFVLVTKAKYNHGETITADDFIKGLLYLSNKNIIDVTETFKLAAYILDIIENENLQYEISIQEVEKMSINDNIEISTLLVCPNCNSTNIRKRGKSSSGKQRYICKDCNRSFTEK